MLPHATQVQERTKEKRRERGRGAQSQFIEFAYFLLLHYVKQFFLLCFQRICRLLLDFVIKDLFVFTSVPCFGPFSVTVVTETWVWWLPELTFLLLDMPATCAWPWAVCLGLVRVRILDSPARGRCLCGLSLCCGPLSGSNAKGWPVGLLNMLRIDVGLAAWHPTSHIYPPSKSYFGLIVIGLAALGMCGYISIYQLFTIEEQQKDQHTF